jgi:E3 ubiquitin-protein ligase MARCH6
MAECRICGSLAAPDRPLRRPCACSGTIKFVHEDCQFRWLNFSGRHRCEVLTCHRSPA